MFEKPRKRIINIYQNSIDNIENLNIVKGEILILLSGETAQIWTKNENDNLVCIANSVSKEEIIERIEKLENDAEKMSSDIASIELSISNFSGSTESKFDELDSKIQENSSNITNVSCALTLTQYEISELSAGTESNFNDVDKRINEAEKTIEEGQLVTSAALNDLNERNIKLNNLVSSIHIDKSSDLTYDLVINGEKSGVSIEIPKNLVVESGQVIKVDDEHPVAGLKNGTYIKLVIKNQDEPLYINVNDLVDVYTGDNETIVIDEENKIKVKDNIFVKITDFDITKNLLYNLIEENEKVIAKSLNDLNARVNGKQDTLTAGEGIEINEYNVISCTLKDEEEMYDRPYFLNEQMYYINYRHLDYNYAKDYFENNKNGEMNLGACSALRSGNIVGRHYDWNYNYECGFVVKTPRMYGRNESYGVCSGLKNLTKENIDKEQRLEDYKILPFFMLDGVNEHGLSAEINVVPSSGFTKTVPIVEKRDSICVIMIVRYVIDHFATVDEAIDYLQKYVEIWQYEKLGNMGFDIHMMLSDKTTNKVVEFIGNEIKTVDSNISTNFHTYGITTKEDGTVYTNLDASYGIFPTNFGIDEHGSGLERWNILNAYEGNSDTVESMIYAMNNVKYSKAYTNTLDEHFWYSEFVGAKPDGSENITVDTPWNDGTFQARCARYKEGYEHRTREEGNYWITCHQSVYDLDNLTLTVSSQESDEHFTFSLKSADASKEYVNLAIENAINEEIARTESTYIKEHQSLENYYTKSDVDEKIETIDEVTAKSLNDLNIRVLENAGLISKLRTDVDDTSTGLTEVSTAVSGLRTDIDDTKTSLAEMNSDISDLKTDVNVVKTGLTEVNTSVSSLRSYVEDDERVISNSLNNLNIRVLANESSINGLRTDVNDAKTGLTEVNTSVSNLRSYVEDDERVISNSLNDLNIRVLANETSINGLRTDVDDVKSGLTDLNSAISDLSSVVDTVKTNLNNTVSEVNSAKADINDFDIIVSTSLNDLNLRLLKLEEKLTNLEDIVKNL